MLADGGCGAIGAGLVLGFGLFRCLCSWLLGFGLDSFEWSLLDLNGRVERLLGCIMSACALKNVHMYSLFKPNFMPFGLNAPALLHEALLSPSDIELLMCIACGGSEGVCIVIEFG